MLEAEIDLSIFKNNLIAIKKEIKSSKLCLVVKADAYGHGIAQIASFASAFIDEFAVATLDEALNLQVLNLNKPIVMLENTSYFGVDSSTMSDIIPLICRVDDIFLLPKGIKAVNVKINSGMNRLGADKKEFKEILSRLNKKGIKLKSILTHFYDGHSFKDTKRQTDIFLSFLNGNASIDKGILLHAGSSSTLSLNENTFYFDMVRCGIAAYGYSKTTNPIMKISTDILQTYSVKKGEHIGYGNYKTNENLKLAIIRIGYADGYWRRKSVLLDDRFVSIDGVLCPVLGQICMDLTAVDVSRVKLNNDSRVYVLGNGINGEDLAKSYGTIVYEVLTSFNKERIKRKYIN